MRNFTDPRPNSCLTRLPSPHMQPEATSAEKLGGALMNAIIFICVIAAMTVVLFFLFKYGVRVHRQRLCMAAWAAWLQVCMGLCPSCHGNEGSLPRR